LFGFAAAGCVPATIAFAPAQGCDVVRVASVAMEAVRGVWAVPVEVNGNRVRLIVDTGAERTLLTETAVTRVAMLRDPHHQTQTFGIGGQSTTDDARVSSFAIGGVYLPVPSVTVGPFTLLSSAGATLDGLLGADILSAFDVDFDTRNGWLTLYRARDCQAAGPPWRGPFLSMGTVRRTQDRLLVPIVLDGAVGVATLDTGAQHTAISEALAGRLGVSAAVLAQDPTITARGAAADRLAVRVHRFRRLQIGPAEVTDPALPVLPIPDGLGDGLAGADFMAGRRLWLSYASLQVFLTPLTAVPPVAMTLGAAGGNRAGAPEAVQ
jgi:predicted aspartyl protease